MGDFDPSVVIPGIRGRNHLDDFRNWFESEDEDIGETNLPPYRPSLDAYHFHLQMGGVFPDIEEVDPQNYTHLQNPAAFNLDAGLRGKAGVETGAGVVSLAAGARGFLSGNTTGSQADVLLSYRPDFAPMAIWVEGNGRKENPSFPDQMHPYRSDNRINWGVNLLPVTDDIYDRAGPFNLMLGFGGGYCYYLVV